MVTIRLEFKLQLGTEKELETHDVSLYCIIAGILLWNIWFLTSVQGWRQN